MAGKLAPPPTAIRPDTAAPVAAAHQRLSAVGGANQKRVGICRTSYRASVYFLVFLFLLVVVVMVVVVFVVVMVVVVVGGVVGVAVAVAVEVRRRERKGRLGVRGQVGGSVRV